MRARGPCPSITDTSRAAALARIVHNRIDIDHPTGGALKFLKSFFSAAHALLGILFVLISALLTVLAIKTGWTAIHAIGGDSDESAEMAIEAIGLLAIAVVSLQIAQTITEEEVVRDAHISAPTRVRRYLSRFMVVVVVALSIEGLVGTFKALHEDSELLPHAASVLVAAGVLLSGWGVFIRFNKAAEELEPEAMEAAKSEDVKVDE
jgi:hypothetical protein